MRGVIMGDIMPAHGLQGGGRFREVPYWASASSDGKRCYVSNSESNDLSVIDFDSATEVARVAVGKYPQRSRLANVPMAIIDNLKK